MRLSFRPADPNDVPALIEIHDRAYGGGYSACFDRYGPPTPQDFWWVQSEKSVAVIEMNRKVAGTIMIGRVGRRLLAEEVLLDTVPAESMESARRQIAEFLGDQFRRERQDQVTVRCAETNAFALALVQRDRFEFANALIVASGGSTGVPHTARALPGGYAIRRGIPADAHALARLHEETIDQAIRPRDLDALFKQPDVRVFLAEREKYPVGFVAAQARDSVGRWSIGVRDAHRRRGIGLALAHAALQFFQSRKLTPITTYWALDPQAARFIRSLGGRTERTFLYFALRI